MAILHLTNTDHNSVDYSIRQGATFGGVRLLMMDGDYTSWTARGQIRNTYVNLGGIVQAAFTFAPLVMGSMTIDGVERLGTLVQPQLSATQTAGLDWSGMTLRRSVKEPAVPGTNVWVYDIYVESPEGVIERIAEGYVEVSLGVTSA